MHVLVRGRLSFYPERGDCQLYLDEMQPRGIGALELAFQQLKERLAARGWFAPSRKKSLPRIPRRIAIVTSPSGAAIRDMLSIIPRRWPAVEIWVVPVRVQGDGAGEDLAAAIRLLNQYTGIDVIVLTRGGGSLEDLWAFNEECLAEAIVGSRIPILSAVGHEVDYTISDFVADRRAATPSEAAEMIVPDCLALLADLDNRQRRLRTGLMSRVTMIRDRLDALARSRVLTQPLARIREAQQRLDHHADKLHQAFKIRLERLTRTVAAQSARLASLSPLNVLSRGYSLTRKEGAIELLRESRQVVPGDRLVTRLDQGEVVSIVQEVRPPTEFKAS
jgi:exodeoxyribonuclease VII large subunit